MEPGLEEAGPSWRQPRWRSPHSNALQRRNNSQVRHQGELNGRRPFDQHDPNRRVRSVSTTRQRYVREERDAGAAGLHRMRGYDGRQHTASPRGMQEPRNRGGYARGNNRNNYNKARFMGIAGLQEIARADVQDMILKINEKRNAFFTLAETPNDRPDIFVLIIDILAKACQSSFEELKLKLLLDICNSNFIKLLMIYLINLPYEQQKLNSLYWNNPDEFWKNYITFCDFIVTTSPMTAMKNCRSLLDATTKSCLEGLKEKHGYSMPKEYQDKLTEIRNKLADFEEVAQEPQQKRIRSAQDHQPPPDDFRLLSVIPNRDDLLITRPFVRPNIVNGRYEDVEHYLDVQFRLLREDCYGPLRDGIQQFINAPDRKKYDHIRVFQRVKFIGTYISKSKVGSIVQIDLNANRAMKRINWANSKRFIYGSLVLFTKDNCKNFIVGTILDRDTRQLSEGKIPVSLIGDVMEEELYNNNRYYTMIESEVYFEPYYHVLKVLQDPKFPENLPMQQYIINVNEMSKHPSYLDENQEFIIRNREAIKENAKELALSLFDSEHFDVSDDDSDVADDTNSIKFKVLQNETWPDMLELNLNESQYDAYKLALTQEFAVIQGPPGTGKTYLGINVAKTLLQNVSNFNGCLMLIICYTNHALDQFLEAIMKITPSVARIGGQSRNKNMDLINIHNLRKSMIHSCDNANKLFLEQRFALKSIISQLRKSQMILDILNNGVISCSCIAHEVLQIRLLRDYYKDIGITNQDALKYWLFDYNPNEYWASLADCLLEGELIDIFDNYQDNDKHIRTEFIVDDDEIINDIVDLSDIKASFSLTDAKIELKNLINVYNQKLKANRTDFYEIGIQIQQLSAQIRFFNAMQEQKSRRFNIRITAATNFNRIRLAERWCLYFMWTEDKINQVKENILELQTVMMRQETAFEESRMVLDMQVLRKRKVLGMTTSGAARMRKLLLALGPRIVIVEEAAEVLEQHIVSSLTKDCQHLILIGDHQQLRPSASHMKLARHFDIEVSLFERMIKNGIHSRCLSVQHRMRPEIAALISPHIYANLENHASVALFPDVLGMDKNLFFFTHQYEEENNIENSSKSNQNEGDMVLALANYLMQQDYTAEDITILAAYSGQMFYLKKQRANYPLLQNVKITVVDNYQGEESKIILLSLVRNNKENKIGFLGTENRICVALSRAREGFYIFGNINILKSNSGLWQNIAVTLEDNGSLGGAINLKCQNHPHQITTVSKVKDFENVPEGGCMLTCNFELKCGHKCRLLCHGYDRGHRESYTRCIKDCEKILCDLNHKCPLKCWETCGLCNTLVEKTLPCKHNMQVRCHLNSEDPTIRCLTTLEVTLPSCGHSAQKLCYENIASVKCKVKCEYRIPTCGHNCKRSCHVNHDPEHEKYLCERNCARAKKGCTAALEGDRGDHQCGKKCYEECDECNVLVSKKRSNCKHTITVACHKSPDETKCIMKCAKQLPCEHFCQKKCYENCGDCKVKVLKEIADCKHKIKIECMQKATRNFCKAKCERTLSCGHTYQQLCAADCDASVCNVITNEKSKLPCGHLVALSCGLQRLIKAGNISEEKLLRLCSEPCRQELACKHMCAGTCGTCHQGRMHVNCLQKCNQLNICGHMCEEPCNQICPPCNMPCEVRCEHSRCNLKCCVPCTPCQEKCNRRCMHRTCSRRCGEQCDVDACSEACPLRLKCGHACRGVCGEPCPPICHVCRPDDFPKDFFGDPYPDDAMFIQLQDCEHILELEDMDTLMLGDAESIKIRTCPFCRKPIINTNRYKNAVNKTFKDDINPIKQRVYGSPTTIKEKRKEVLIKIANYPRTYKEMLEGQNKEWTNKLTLLIKSIKSLKNESVLDLEMTLIYINILDMLSECYKKYIALKSTELKEEMHKQISFVCKALVVFRKRGKDVLKISQQLQMDAGNEIKRLNAIIQFSIILSHPTYKSSKSIPEVKQAFDEANALVFSPAVYKADDCLNALKKLEQAVKVSGIVSKAERDLVVKAMNMKAGSWYKCPNGHYYCIADCGGAVMESVCIECKAKVGGTNHKLLSSNRHAGEIDGSRYAAYSEQYNNMANFMLNI